MTGDEASADEGPTTVPVTLYTRENCSLCVIARETIESVAADLDPVTVDIDEIDVDTDPELADEYGERVPYVLVDGHPAFKYEVDERDLRLKLLAAT
ncbi:Glutaredoxin [Halorubrum ezzemoulense]|uniref:Glutaredoxin n=2 Tax=Halorubrum ezzemoulense TaxID=337243 RepID=A0A238X0V4_HALEZ|nr:MULTISPECIES: glutaredoxin family protein [Halorubrum]MDB2225567.1 glutaredoxin family protein [Halorubrum ezzemoulense]MDB2260581.1 glutaredoxin family protein [Halorubrum ezzemoulense]MDB2264996.1 glutaredoxin family protein [Halorubrum ezzemoulense]MDB2267026.1 glutaredoxin family protein [Halorubrum ezzemoulense]MDB9234132.1 glutaredoxin family protein [Halorubrum ezzemoulense]